jgi:hypothetical protein
VVERYHIHFKDKQTFDTKLDALKDAKFLTHDYEVYRNILKTLKDRRLGASKKNRTPSFSRAIFRSKKTSNPYFEQGGPIFFTKGKKNPQNGVAHSRYIQK